MVLGSNSSSSMIKFDLNSNLLMLLGYYPPLDACIYKFSANIWFEFQRGLTIQDFFHIIIWTLVETLLESYFKLISVVKSALDKICKKLANYRNS